LTKRIKQPDEGVNLQRFWKHAVGFWGPHGARLAWVLSTLILFTVLINLGATYGMNVWTGAIFDALQNSDSRSVLFLSLIYLPLLAASVLLSVANVYAARISARIASFFPRQ
jgi:vitamin B12/bleomycin/antimicrobial peptide transport system ATP-binding/permease protein